MSVRSRVLSRFFSLLYGPLVFLHEPAGTCLFGASWDGRRKDVVDLAHRNGLLLDIGCGEGRLLACARERGYICVGVEPSTSMIGRGTANGARMIQGRAGCLPIIDASVASIVVTYPGPWIRQHEVWREFERVLQPDGRIVILLGGTVERGSGSWLRALAGRLVYGTRSKQRLEFTPPLSTGSRLVGVFEIQDDRWGTVYRWRGHLTGA